MIMALLLLWKKSSVPLLLLRGGGLLPRISQSKDYSSSSDDVKELFEEWTIKMDKVYETLKDKQSRFRNFKKCFNMVKKHNTSGHFSSTLGLNKSSDWTDAERKARRCPRQRQRIPLTAAILRRLHFEDSTSPDEDGCDYEHWLVVVEKPQGTRDEVIHSYIKILEKVVGSYDEARMKIYSVSTRCYYAFGALASKEDSYKLRDCPGVVAVLPDSYIDAKNKDYGGEPFIDGKAVPYDPKYHKEWNINVGRNYTKYHKAWNAFFRYGRVL